MRLVVDTNVLITFFWKESTFSNILKGKKLELFSPEISLKEIKKYEEEIIKKTNVTLTQYIKRKEELLTYVQFLNEEKYSDKLRDIFSTLTNLNENEKEELLNDIDFLALSIKLNCPLWSHDKLLKKQGKVIIFTTKEVIELI